MANYAPADRIGLMDLYFPYSSHTSAILRAMRQSIFTGKKIDICSSDVVAVQQEVKEMRQRIDGSTPEFAQDLNVLVFGDAKEDPVRAFIVVTGNLLGDAETIENIVIARDLGTNPWPLYKGREGYDTVDTRLTREQTEAYSRERGLRQKGHDRFFVRESSFFYIRDSDLERNGFLDPNGVKIQELVPYLVGTHGFVGLEEASKPDEKDYAERGIPFLAYRQKESLLEKTIRRLCERDPFTHEGDAIADWGAHRICLETEENALYWGNVFKEYVKAGRFVTGGLHTDDYYANPKETGFKAFNVTARVSRIQKGRGRKPKKDTDVVREIQIYDLMQHFNAQLNEASPAYHGNFRRSQTDSQRKRRSLMHDFEYDVVLEFMFGAKKLEVHLPN